MGLKSVNRCFREVTFHSRGFGKSENPMHSASASTLWFMLENADA